MGGGGSVLFDAESKSVVKNFSFTKRSGLRIFPEEGGGGPYFLMLSPNLWSKFFPLPSALDLEFFQTAINVSLNFGITTARNHFEPQSGAPHFSAEDLVEHCIHLNHKRYHSNSSPYENDNQGLWSKYF